MRVLGLLLFFSLWSAPVQAAPVRITFSGVGDIVFGRAGERFGLEDPFRHVSQVWKGRDIVYGNLETPVSAQQYRNIRKPKNCAVTECNEDQKSYRRIFRLTFWGRPEAVGLLKTAGFTVMGTANNHAEDQGPQGLLDTIAHLKKGNLAYCGTGATVEDAWTPYVYEKQGVKVALLAVTALWNFPPMRQGAFYALTEFPKITTELPAKVKELKAKYDFVIVALHYGEEYTHQAESREKKLMKLIEAAGADAVIGGHPHVLRGIQVINRMVVFYSMGNFLFDNNKDAQIESGVAAFDLVKDGAKKTLENIAFHPVRNEGNPGWILPKAVTGPHAQALLKKMLRYSRSLDNADGELAIEGDKLVVKPRAMAGN